MLVGKGYVRDGVGVFVTVDGRRYVYRYGRLSVCEGERIALVGGEPFDVWAGRGGVAQSLYRAYRARWPHSCTFCAAVGSDLYVRGDDGVMRRVCSEADFDVPDEWCAQCGVPVDPDGGDCYGCDALDCRNVLCGQCGDCLAQSGCYCPYHRHVAGEGLV